MNIDLLIFALAIVGAGAGAFAVRKRLGVAAFEIYRAAGFPRIARSSQFWAKMAYFPAIGFVILGLILAVVAVVGGEAPWVGTR